MRLRGRTERSTTRPASIFAAATPATAFISCFARHVEGATEHQFWQQAANTNSSSNSSEDSKESKLVADPS